MLILNNTTRLIVLNSPGRPVHLTVGANNCPDDTDLGSPSVRSMIEAGELSVPGKADGEQQISFSELKQAEALSVVAKTYDKELLAKFAEETKNNQVKGAIKTQIALLEEQEAEIAEAEAARKAGGN